MPDPLTDNDVTPKPTPKLVGVGLAVGALGAAAWLARWLVQGESTIWTDIARRFYAPDATLGWVQTDQSWVWLGLEGLGALGAVLVGTLGLVFAARRLGSKPRLAKVLGVLSQLGAGVALLGPVLPAWAFVSGTPPAGSAIVMPEVVAPANAAPSLSVSATRWQVAPSERANLLAVRIEAGKETFDGRFKPVTGTLEFDVKRPEAAVALLQAPATSLETGVEMRDGHARGYLEAEKFPTVTLRVHTIVLAADNTFTAEGELGLMDRQIAVAVTGNVQALSVEQRAELELAAPEALLVTASFPLAISQTALKRENFDSDRLVVTARVALVPTP